MLVAALLVNANNIRYNNDASSKKRVLEELSLQLAANTKAVTSDEIFQALFERERLGSTGLGKGIAIPHARIPGLTHTLAAMLRLESPVDFESADRKPIDIAFGLLVPEDGNDHHLQQLGLLATLFRSAENCEKIRQANSADEIFEVLLAIDEA